MKFVSFQSPSAMAETCQDARAEYRNFYESNQALSFSEISDYCAVCQDLLTKHSPANALHECSSDGHSFIVRRHPFLLFDSLTVFCHADYCSPN